MSTTHNTHPHAAAIARLRARTDIIERHPDVDFYTSDDDPLLVYCTDRKEVAAAARAIGGRWDKDADEVWLNLTQRIDGVTVRLYTNRKAACEARVVGTEPITEERYRDEQRAEQLKAELDALTEQVVVGKREIVEWDCGPVLDGAA